MDEFKIPAEFLEKSAEAIREQLGHHGIEKIGGKTWWQWRRQGGDLKAEWIEMRSDAAERKKAGDKGGKRVMLYVHGGAYFFGSTDEHRYQMQRHARKLKARVLARKCLRSQVKSNHINLLKLDTDLHHNFLSPADYTIVLQLISTF